VSGVGIVKFYVPALKLVTFLPMILEYRFILLLFVVFLQVKLIFILKDMLDVPAVELD